MADTIEVRVVSFGYGHGKPPLAEMTFDVREHFRDPHVSPELRELTGTDDQVIETVLDTPGVHALINAILTAAFAYLEADRPVTIAIGCAGGRHRSVVIANEIALGLEYDGVHVATTHRDIAKQVIRR